VHKYLGIPNADWTEMIKVLDIAKTGQITRIKVKPQFKQCLHLMMEEVVKPHKTKIKIEQRLNCVDVPLTRHKFDETDVHDWIPKMHAGNGAKTLVSLSSWKKKLIGGQRWREKYVEIDIT
jgi:hypothetical protein